MLKTNNFGLDQEGRAEALPPLSRSKLLCSSSISGDFREVAPFGSGTSINYDLARTVGPQDADGYAVLFLLVKGSLRELIPFSGFRIKKLPLLLISHKHGLLFQKPPISVSRLDGKALNLLYFC